MKKIRCLIVDDEEPAIDLLLNYASMVDSLEVVATSHSAVKAFDVLREQDVDLMFLDIQMPVLNGLDFIKSLTHPPAIVLTTAYREYALEGYDLDVVDYLLKPIAFDRFLRAVDRYTHRTQDKPQSSEMESNTPDHIFLNVNKTQHKVYFRDIVYIESLKDYVRIHLLDDKLVVKGNLGSMMSRLPGEIFVRVHRSFAISLHQIQAYNHSEVDVGGVKLPVGVSYKERFLQRFE